MTKSVLPVSSRVAEIKERFDALNPPSASDNVLEEDVFDRIRDKFVAYKQSCFKELSPGARSTSRAKKLAGDIGDYQQMRFIERFYEALARGKVDGVPSYEVDTLILSKDSTDPRVQVMEDAKEMAEALKKQMEAELAGYQHAELFMQAVDRSVTRSCSKVGINEISL